jgi:hypothetical protein
MRRWFLAFPLGVSIFATVVACGDGQALPRSNVDLHGHLDRTPPDDGDWTFEEAREFKNFDLYWLGQEFQNLPLTKIMRFKTNTSAGSPQDSVWFVYGTCKTSGSEGGCAAPLSIQIQPFCENTQIYNQQKANIVAFRGRGEAAPPTTDGSPFYVWTGRVSVRISGLLETSAAGELVSIQSPGPTSPTEPLPALVTDC